MNVGSQFLAPRGLHSLRRDVTYYFLKSQSKRVLCVELIDVDHERNAILHILGRDIFEAALAREDVIVAPVQTMWPPWLGKFEGHALDWIDETRKHALNLHRDRVNARVAHILPAVNERATILAAEFPDVELNLYARRCSPQQNERRFRLWFYVYLLFRQDAWSLLPPFHLAGRWERDSTSVTKKLGRPSKYGPGHGYNATGMASKIVESYLRWVLPGRTRARIYVIAMVKDFGCKTIREGHDKVRIVHPLGLPFPSFDEFFYYVEKEFGVDAIQREKIGEARMRAKEASQGSFSEATANFMERTEADGYYTDDEPTPFVPGTNTQPICCVQVVCVATGFRAGFGGSPGQERAVAYREALFSMAVGMEKYFALFGLRLHPYRWPTPGLPGELIPDRGPGGSATQVDDIDARIPIVSYTPSHSPQSKGTVESANPRSTHFGGRPTVVRSKLTRVQMFRRELIRAAKANYSCDVTSRLTPEMLAAGVPGNPLGMADFLDQHARNDGNCIPFERAVPAYLTRLDFTVRDDGVWLEGRRFDSKGLRKTGLLERAAKGQVFRVDGYILQMCVRFAWIEVKSEIVEVAAMLRLREDEEQLYVTYLELQQLEKIRKATAHEQSRTALAADMEFVERSLADTGSLPDAGTRSPRRARKRTKPT